MGELDPVEMNRALSKKLIAGGVPKGESKNLATREVNSMGVVKVFTGQCPLGARSSLACTFCSFGHLTDCHYPQTCEEAQCSHYQQQRGYEEDSP